MKMMDKKKIIEDGILEQYILGELHPSDERYIEQLLASDPELKQHFDTLEADFETLGLENAVVPPPTVKNELLSRATALKSEGVKQPTASKASRFKFYFAVAASFSALFLATSIWLYSQLNRLENDVKMVETEKQDLKTELNQLSESYDTTAKLYATLSHPDTKQYVLEGNTLMPQGKVISFVNHDLKSVVINTERLPELDEAHNYQMWADVEGEMIDMGVIDTSQSLVAMNYIDASESLNITIEPLGGSEHPTVERLVTNVYL
jgi:anti-sigma-K factor RskA